MSGQSGCDPMAAVNARLRHLLVENEPTPDWFKAFENKPPVFPDARTPGSQIVGYKYNEHLYAVNDLSDEDYERLRELWLKFDPKLSVVIDKPMVYVPMGDPGDETDHNW